VALHWTAQALLLVENWEAARLESVLEALLHRRARLERKLAGGTGGEDDAP
jgi:hypothetical protein